MITKLEVSNYKSIKKLDLDMRPFMTLVGPNGSGKTNVVKAMELLGDVVERGTTEPVSELGWTELIRRERGSARTMRFGVSLVLDPPNVSAPRPKDPVSVHLEITLSGKIGERDVQVTAERCVLTSKKSALELTWSNTLSVEPGSDPALWALVVGSPFGRALAPLSAAAVREKFKHRQTFLEGFDATTELKLINRGLGRIHPELLRQCATTRLRLDASALRSDARTPTAHRSRIGPNGEGLPVAVDLLRSDRTNSSWGRILTALRAIYPRIRDVIPERFGHGRVTLNFEEEGIKDPVPLDSVSDGVLHALALLIALETHRRGILAIEEPENALHPWSVRQVIDLAQSKTGAQILLTTHSESVVNCVKHPGSLFVVDGDEADGTTVAAATSKEDALEAILRESGQKLGDVWVGGTLGGVPRQ